LYCSWRVAQPESVVEKPFGSRYQISDGIEKILEILVDLLWQERKNGAEDIAIQEQPFVKHRLIGWQVFVEEREHNQKVHKQKEDGIPAQRGCYHLRYSYKNEQ
jgi:hypothetical protein